MLGLDLLRHSWRFWGNGQTRRMVHLSVWRNRHMAHTRAPLRPVHWETRWRMANWTGYLGHLGREVTGKSEPRQEGFEHRWRLDLFLWYYRCKKEQSPLGVCCLFCPSQRNVIQKSFQDFGKGLRTGNRFYHPKTVFHRANDQEALSGDSPNFHHRERGGKGKNVLRTHKMTIRGSHIGFWTIRVKQLLKSYFWQCF